MWTILALNLLYSFLLAFYLFFFFFFLPFVNLQQNTTFTKRYLQTSRDSIACQVKVFWQTRFQGLGTTASSLVTAAIPLLPLNFLLVVSHFCVGVITIPDRSKGEEACSCLLLLRIQYTLVKGRWQSRKVHVMMSDKGKKMRMLTQSLLLPHFTHVQICHLFFFFLS